MLAKKYEQMMIDDDNKEAVENGHENFEVLADQKAEQDYAINVFKGSGNMSEVFDQIKKESRAEKKKEQAKKKEEDTMK